MKRTTAYLGALALATMLPLSGLAGASGDTIEILDGKGYSGMAAQWQNVTIASRPTPAELARLAKAGTVTVINLRTPAEMEALGFDESELVGVLGMNYVHVPLDGRDYPHNPVALDKVSAALAAAGDKPVLLHCASSGRASHMFAAWLISARGKPVDEAVSLARQIGLSAMPVENLLGTTFELKARDD